MGSIRIELRQTILMQSTTGTFNYLTQEVESSLYRNSKVMIQRNLEGSDSQAVGLEYTPTDVQVINARELDAKPNLVANGFELISAPLERDIDFFDSSDVLQNYYRQCEQIVADYTGAKAFAFDHNIRSASGKKEKVKLKAGQAVQGPAHAVHGDYTLTSAPQRLRDLAAPPSANDTIAALLQEGDTLLDGGTVEEALEADGRFAIINVWRNIVEEPVVMHPMAFCDGQTVKPEDLVVFEIHYSDRVGENYFAKHTENHRWYYYPEVTKDEAILIKQWDSAGNLAQTKGSQGDVRDTPCTFSFHSAFKDPAIAADAPDRWSIEVRCAVLYS